MSENTPESTALALGTLIGTVNGLVQTLKDQNAASAKNREEFLEIFKGIRQDNKDNNDALQTHIKEDLIYHGAMNEFAIWKKDTESKVDNLWDNQNRQKGAVIASGTIGSVLGGAIVAAIEWLKK